LWRQPGYSLKRPGNGIEGSPRSKSLIEIQHTSHRNNLLVSATSNSSRLRALFPHTAQPGGCAGVTCSPLFADDTLQGLAESDPATSCVACRSIVLFSQQP
jgi:hypothetical protein